MPSQCRSLGGRVHFCRYQGAAWHRSTDVQARAEHRILLEELAYGLTDREREVLRLRFEEDLTQEEIGALVGVSQMHVSRPLRQTLARLRLAAAPQEGGARGA